MRHGQALPGKTESNGKGLRQSGSSGSVEFGLDTWMLPAEMLQDVAAHGQLNDCDHTDPNEQRVLEVWGEGAGLSAPAPCPPVQEEKLHAGGNVSGSLCAGEQMFFVNKTCPEEAGG